MEHLGLAFWAVAWIAAETHSLPKSQITLVQEKKAVEEKKVGESLPADLFVNKEPDGAKSVEEVRASAKVGDKVVVRGRVGGSASPFVEGRAVFTIVGAGLKACSDKPDDHCKQPWDYCCDPPEVIAKHNATIQVVTAAGRPFKAGLKGQNELKELSEVMVQGTVKEIKEKLFIVNAKAIYVVKP